MKRILIIGCCGAGKSTLALALAAKLNLLVCHLDKLFWLAGWVENSSEQFDAELAEVLKNDAWIMDANYNRTLPERLKYANAVIYLDYPRHICLFRTLKRIFCFHGRARADMSVDCPERFDWEFLRYVWNFHRDMRPKLVHALQNFPGRCIQTMYPQAGTATQIIRELERIS